MDQNSNCYNCKYVSKYFYPIDCTCVVTCVTRCELHKKLTNDNNWCDSFYQVDEDFIIERGAIDIERRFKNLGLKL